MMNPSMDFQSKKGWFIATQRVEMIQNAAWTSGLAFRAYETWKKITPSKKHKNLVSKILSFKIF